MKSEVERLDFKDKREVGRLVLKREKKLRHWVLK